MGVNRLRSFTVSSARLYVTAHGCKRFVIALKYEGEPEYRYWIAKDLTWRTMDIINAYQLRWLIEVFFEDGKRYEGWGQLAKQPGEEGSSTSLTLSLLYDHALLFHPEQTIRLRNKQPACTVGSLCERSRAEALLVWVENLLNNEHPGEQEVISFVFVWKRYEFTGVRKIGADTSSEVSGCSGLSLEYFFRCCQI